MKLGVKKRRRRRSELRLGVRTVNYHTTASRPNFSITPVLRFWHLRGARLSGIFTLALLGWIVYILFSTPLFFVYGAEIQGNVAVANREIYAASAVDNQSVFWINPVEVVDRILALPNIKSASVSVSLPARITIEVIERRPEILWQTEETIWWVDEEGTIVPPKGNIDGMLRIIDDDRQPLQAGYRIDQTIVKGAQMLRILAPDVSVIRHSRQQGLTVATPEGWPVYLGDGSQVKAKLVVLTALLTDLNERNVTPAFIDVRNPLRPFYRPKNIVEIGEPALNQSQLRPRPAERP